MMTIRSKFDNVNISVPMKTISNCTASEPWQNASLLKSFPLKQEHPTANCLPGTQSVSAIAFRKIYNSLNSPDANDMNDSSLNSLAEICSFQTTE